MKTVKNIVFAVLVSFCSFWLAGCSAALGTYPATTPLISTTSYTVVGNVSGTSSSFSLLFIPFGTNTPLHNALQSAMKQKSADALIDVQADYYVYNFLYLFGIYTTEVRGKAIKIKTISESSVK